MTVQAAGGFSSQFTECMYNFVRHLDQFYNKKGNYAVEHNLNHTIPINAYVTDMIIK